MKKKILLVAILMLALTLTACVGKKDNGGSVAQVPSDKTHSYNFTVAREVPADQTDFFIKALKKRLEVFGYPEAQVNLSGGKNINIEIKEKTGVIFLENEFLQYMSNTPTFEIRTQEDPEKLVLTDKEKAQLEKFNSDAKAKAQGLLESVLAKPETFAEVAKNNSEDPGSKDNGGAYTGVKKGQFVPEYEDVVFNKLKVGEIYPQLVETAFGYHIIKKDAQRGEGDTLEVDTSHILIAKKTERQILAARQWLETGLVGYYIDIVNPVQQKKDSFAFQISFDENGKQLLAEITKNNIGKPIAIFIDGVGIGTPTVKNEITDGKLVITGNFTQKGVTAIAQRLSSGAIQFPLQLQPAEASK